MIEPPGAARLLLLMYLHGRYCKNSNIKWQLTIILYRVLCVKVMQFCEILFLASFLVYFLFFCNSRENVLLQHRRSERMRQGTNKRIVTIYMRFNMIECNNKPVKVNNRRFDGIGIVKI